MFYTSYINIIKCKRKRIDSIMIYIKTLEDVFFRKLDVWFKK